jgi:hypothetical protein
VQVAVTEAAPRLRASGCLPGRLKTMRNERSLVAGPCVYMQYWRDAAYGLVVAIGRNATPLVGSELLSP